MNEHFALMKTSIMNEIIALDDKLQEILGDVILCGEKKVFPMLNTAKVRQDESSEGAH